MGQDKNEALWALLSDTPEEAFQQGAARDLLARRNPKLGNLFLSPRALYYLQILYGMLLFRRRGQAVKVAILTA